MRVPLAQQVQELLGQRALVILTERVDDVALLMAPMVQRGLPESLDRHSPRHGTQRGRSWGWTAVLWLASIVTEGDHRQVSVEPSRQGMPHPLSHLTAQGIAPRDFRDDRLSHRLKHWRQLASWHQIAHACKARSLAVSPWPQDGIRCEATTVSGDHEVPPGGLGPFGQSNDAPTRPQSKVMRGSLAPLGRPLATAVVSGARAEDGFYLPIIERIRTGWQPPGLLGVGAWQIRAWDTRADLVRPQACSLSPLPLTGATGEAMAAWSTPGVSKGEAGA